MIITLENDLLLYEEGNKHEAKFKEGSTRT